MVLSEQQRGLRWQIEWIAFMGIHSVLYFDGVTHEDGDFWIFTQKCYGEKAVSLWCQLFNSYQKDPTHYHNLFGEDQMAILGDQFSYKNVKARLVEASGFKEEEYPAYRETVVNFRNRYSSHRDYEIGSIIFPELKHALLMFKEIRTILEESVLIESSRSENGELSELKEYFQINSNQNVEYLCQENIARIKFFE